VKEYYHRIGFNFENEPFEVPANQFIANYFSLVDKAGLHNGAEEILEYFSKKGFTQLVLSAAEQQKLEGMIDACQIKGFFTSIKGLDHDYATSKVELGVEMLAGLGIPPEKALLIGDTCHDFEVASELRCHCLLVANGHHPFEKLLKTGAPVVNGLAAVKGVV
jgi:phosphoglycolate phosphatase